MSKTKSQLAKQYQKKTDKQHILDAPDTYIGSVEEDNVVNWCLKDGKFQFELIKALDPTVLDIQIFSHDRRLYSCSC